VVTVTNVMLDAPLEVAVVVSEGEGVDPDGGPVAPGGASCAGGCSDGAPRGRGFCYWRRVKDRGQRVIINYPVCFYGQSGILGGGNTRRSGSGYFKENMGSGMEAIL